MIATSQFTISVVNDGAPGATGPQGTSVLKVVEEYRLSDSNTELTGSGTGYTWSETKPSIPAGKYLWIRERTDLSNNTSTYGTAHCDVVISGLVFDVGKNTNAITSKVWESDITTKINEYDGSTGADIRNRVSQTETNISGITSRVSDVESETDSLGTRMTSAESSITQNANNIQSKVSQDGVISAINQSAESILISASKVDIQGAVSFSSLDSTLQGRITGVESTASTANNTANTANATANTALKGMKVYSGTCSTAAGTAAKVVSCSDTDFEMTNGTTITIKFSTASTAASPTLNVNTKGAKAIYFDGAEVSSSNIFRWQAGSVITFQYDGTHWVVIAYQNLDYFICSTAAGTTAKATNSVTGTFVLCKGTTITVFFGTSNSVNAPTLNVGSTGAYAIYYKNAVTSANNQYLWSANTTVNFTFNGSYWYVNDGGAQLVKDYAKTAVDWVGTNGSTVVSAANIMKTWTDDATLATTTIDGGYIKTHTIESTHLATNAIMSQNYSRTDTSSPYSSTGAFLDLETGTLYMPNFGVNGTTGASYFNGTVNANAGKFGDDTSYWNIETVYDYNMQPHAALVGTGSPYLQTGNWQVSDNAVATRKYTSTSESAGNATYYKDSDSNTFYDVGMKIPTNFAAYSTSDSSVVKYNKAFYYGRKYTGNNAPSLDSDWTYFFSIDSGGNVITAGDVYEGGVKLSEKYAAITDVGSAYLPKTGGTITGDLTVNGKLDAKGTVTTTLMLQTNLGSTSAAQLTGSASAIIKPGITGTLGVGNGGTGKTTALDAANAFITALPTWTATPTDNTYFIRRDTGGAASYGQVKFSTLWTYINNKITSEYDITNTYRRLDDNQFDTIDITDAQIGNLIVTGAARFTNGLYGTASEASKVTNALKIQLNGGTTEGTSQFTYDGSAVKNINITRSSIGLGAAADKAVDTSIAAGSSSANLPTSAAVAAFVEGKGYVTSSGVTSVRVQATSPVVSSQNTAQSSTLNTTISLADSYGDTKNPYGTKTANYVLAGPSSGNAAAPSFRKLVAADIPSITKSKISDFPTTWALANVTGADDLKAIEGLTGTSGILKKTAANTWALSTVISGLSINNDVLTVTKSDGTTQDLTINITGQVVSGATILSDASGNPISEGSTSKPVYFSNGVPVSANTIPTIALNGGNTTSPSFYAPTAAGTSGQYLKSNGSGAPTWATFSKSTIGLGNVDNTADANKNVLTATKFATAQSVTLTGDTTGTASSQAGWSLATTTGQITPTVLTNQDLNDCKTIGKTLYYYAGGSNNVKHNPASTSETPSGDGMQFGMVTYTTASGHVTQELSCNANKWIRNYASYSSSWSAWQKFVTSGNYTDYTVKKDGTGATGTWGINISGTATNATYAKYLSFQSTNELRFDINTKPSSNTVLHVGYKWSDGSTDAKINRYIFHNGGGANALAEVEASTFYGDLSGNATSATKATQDSDGNAINTTYMKKSGGTFTGDVTGTSFAASDYISANNGSGTAGGVNLYNRTNIMEYAIMFRWTSNQVKHGFVQSDWATYFTMGGNASNIGTRGWIFKDCVNSKGVASISGAGNMALNGELAIGTTGTDINGSCSLVMDRNLSCLNFVFN